MLATLLRRIGSGLGLGVTVWLGACGWFGLGWGLALGPVLGLLGLNVLALLVEQGLAAWVHGQDPAPRPSLVRRLRAWAGEWRRSSRTFGWDMPFASQRWPDRLDGDGGRGVLLVHGYLCNRGFWNAWYPSLQARGVPFVGVSLEPVFGSIDAYADQIDAALVQLHQATGQAPLVVCHSMGGLALRAWRRTQQQRGVPPEQADARVHRVLTLGTPHRGTWLARLGRQLNSSQMRLDSPWLRTLAASEAPAWRARFHCVWSECDNVVFPPRCGVLDGAVSVQRPGRGHQELLDDPAVFEQVLALRQASVSGPGSGGAG